VATSLTAGRPAADHPSSTHLLGTLGMLASPLVLLQALLPTDGSAGQARLVGLMGLVYLAGWAASLVGLRRLGALGDGAGAPAVLGVQLALVALAALFSLQEIVYGGMDRMPLPILDLAWPLGHTVMLATGAAVLRAGRWRGWRAWSVLAPGLKMPILVALAAAGVPAPMGMRGVPGLVAVAWAAAALLLLGWAVRTGGAARDR
jgi:hypothetical protein